jgi:hypothetical protein
MEKVETKRAGGDIGDLRDPSSMDAFMEAQCAMARETFEELGEFRARAVVLTTKDQRGLSMARPGMHVIKCAGTFEDEEKEQFSQYLAEHCVRFEAFGIVFASEVWLGVGHMPGADGKEVQPRFRPDRIEGIFISLEHVALPGTRVYFAQITRDADGKGTLGKFANRYDTASKHDGRFSNFLKPIKAKVN